MKHNVFVMWLILVSCDAMVLVSPSCDVDIIINGTIACLRSEWSKWAAIWALVIWHHWHWHMIAKPSSMEPLHYLVGTSEIRCNMMVLVMWCLWHLHQHHMMPVALSIEPLHSLGQDDQNEVQHDVWFMWHIGTVINITRYWQHCQ